MHDVKQDSFFKKIKGTRKKDIHDERLAPKYKDYEHRHVHEDNEEHELHHHEHDDEHYNGHDHEHDEEEYHDHEDDEHHHNHPKEQFVDRAFEHVHEHGHQFIHTHYHVHHKEETSVVHKWFKDPVRDWFALLVVGVLIGMNITGLVRDALGKGFLVMAAVIGLFPLVKNSIIKGILGGRFIADLVVSLILIIALFYGQIFYVAVAVFLLLLGSFLRLNFSWGK